MTVRSFVLFAVAVSLLLVASVSKAQTLNIDFQSVLTEERTWDRAGQMAVDGEFVYLVPLSRDTMIAIYDFSDPSSPVEVAVVDLGSWIYFLHVRDGFAYAIVGNGLLVIDLSDPGNPRFLGSLADSIDTRNGALLHEGTLYSLGHSVLGVDDVTRPEHPLQLPSLLPFGAPQELAIDGDRAYVTTNLGLHTYDISNPTDISTFSFSTDIVDTGWYGDFEVADDVGYIFRGPEAQIWDLSDSANPTEIASFTGSGWFLDVEVVGSLAYLAGHGGLTVLDVAVPSAPIVVGKFPAGSGEFSEVVGVRGRTVLLRERNLLVVVEYTGPQPPELACPDCTPTPPVPGTCDSGYYLLDSFGGRHAVGDPASITGPLYFGSPIARDMEKAVFEDEDGFTDLDLVVLDAFGAASFVEDMNHDLPQDFYFPPDAAFPQGRAVDVVLAADSQGTWTLTDYGAIYRTGSAVDPGEDSLVENTDRMGTIGFDVPYGMFRTPGFPQEEASLRAVSLAVFDTDENNRAEAYIVIDSQGGRFHVDDDGQSFPPGFSVGLPPNDPSRLYDPEGYEWPFFRGLDIARDLEVDVSLQGAVLLDGWGGIHPVPVDVEDNPVYFANNRVSNSDPTPTSLVGLPYITSGFDDPSTPDVDEGDKSAVGPDAASIFTDLEFTTCQGGFYTLDKFGGVFALGNARPIEDEVSPSFEGSPYFFPFLYAEDFEFFGVNESDFETSFRGCETSFCLAELPLENLEIPAKPLRFVRISGDYGEGDDVNDRKGGGEIVPLIDYDFFISQTEVTVGQWLAVPGPHRSVIDDKSLRAPSNFPVTNVSWDDVQSFLFAMNSQGTGLYRLPSETEWVIACGAGTTTRFFFGDSICDTEQEDCPAGTLPGNRSDYMWFVGSLEPTDVLPVGLLLPNRFGLFDISGNAKEWCQDAYIGGAGWTPTDGSPRENSENPVRAVRGGSVFSWANKCATRSREGIPRDERVIDVGFRMVREVD